MADLRDTNRSGLVALAGLVAVLVGILSLSPAMQGDGWWITAALFAGTAVAVQCACRAFGLPQAAGALIALTTVPLLALAIDGGAGFPWPTPASANTVDAALQLGVRQIVEDAVPVQPTPGLVLIVAASTAAAAVLVDVVAVGLRAPVAAMLVVLALVLVPGKALPVGTDGWLLFAVAITVLLVVAADRRRRGRAPRLAGIAAGGAGAIVVALLVQGVLPAPAEAVASLPSQPLFGPGVDPLVRLAQDLRRGANTPVISYRSTLAGRSTADPEYLRLAVLEDFSGRTWQPNRADLFYTGDGLPQTPAVPGVDVNGAPLRTTAITPLNQFAVAQRLPLPYPPVSVTGVVGWAWDTKGLTLSRASGLGVSSYSVQSAEIDESAKKLAAATTSVPQDDAETAVVPRVSALVSRTARSWTAKATTPYAKALAIQDALTGGSFAYDENTPVQPTFNGDNLAVVDKFLQVKRGYCVHFASTMAVMARLVGIPSRIVVGYQPGQKVGDGSGSHYVVTSDDLHAWPELYFDDYGWVRFEPTPGRGVVPSYAPISAAPGSAQQQEVASAGASASPSVAAPSSSATAAAVAGQGGGATGPDLTGLFRGAGIGALALLVLAIPALLREAVRRHRLRRARGPGGVRAGWREVLDTALDLGVEVPTGVSPRVTEAALASAVPGVQPQLGRVRGVVERDAYAPLSVRLDAADVAAVLAGLRAGATGPARARAAFAPPALAAMLGRVATGVRVVTTGERRMGSRRSPGRGRTSVGRARA